MICQISPIKTKTQALAKLKESLAQAEVKGHLAELSLPEHVELWSPITSGPYIVPVTRWIE